MKKKIQNILPNTLTISRMVFIPLLIVCFYMSYSWSRWPIAIVFSIASVTDFLDGYLARYWSVQSKFGAFMDPIADKIVVIATMIMLIHLHIIDNFTILPALMIVCREILISGLREFLAREGKIVGVIKVAKIKTATQMAALLILIISNDGFLKYFGSVLLWISSFLAIYSAISYFKKSYNIF